MSRKYTGGRIHVAEGEEGGEKNCASSSRKQNFAKRGKKNRKRDLMACLHGDSGSQVGEVTRLGGVTSLSI